jgi:biopolymer transport protein ExbD
MALKARRSEVDASLNINSMMDMMTIILVFLLKSYATSDVSVAPSAELVLPFSSAQKAPQLAVNLVIEKSKLLVDGVAVMALTTEPDEANPGQELVAVPADELQGQLVGKLYDRLREKADGAKSLAAQSGNSEHEFKGRILLQVDKDMPFSVLRTIMYTAGQAEFGEFRFIVYKQG